MYVGFFCRKMYYIYILRCEDKSLYTGITTDIERRFQEHEQKTKKGAKYTHIHSPVQIEAIWTCENRSQASKLEHRIKRLSKIQKEKMIKDTDYFQQLLKNRIHINEYHRKK